MTNEEYDGTGKGTKFMIYLFIAGFLICMLSFTAFYVGTKVACKTGYSEGFTCVKPKEIGVCDFEGTKYVVPEGQQDFKGGLYRKTRWHLLSLRYVSCYRI